MDPLAAGSRRGDALRTRAAGSARLCPPCLSRKGLRGRVAWRLRDRREAGGLPRHLAAQAAPGRSSDENASRSGFGGTGRCPVRSAAAAVGAGPGSGLGPAVPQPQGAAGGGTHPGTHTGARRPESGPGSSGAETHPSTRPGRLVFGRGRGAQCAGSLADRHRRHAGQTAPHELHPRSAREGFGNHQHLRRDPQCERARASGDHSAH